MGGDTTVSSVIHHQQHIAAVRNPPTRKGELTVLFTIDYPEILLVEDSMNPDTNALIFEVACSSSNRESILIILCTSFVCVSVLRHVQTANDE